MKARKFINFSAMLLAVAALAVTGCKKDDNSDDTASVEQLTADQYNMETTIDEATRDIDGVYSSGLKSSNFDNRMPCNVSIDSVAIANDTITLDLVYNGLNCSGTLNRTGKIEIKKRVGERWGEPGSSLMTKFMNYTVTRVSTGKSVTLNGSHLFTNVSGGFIFMVGIDSTSVIFESSASLQATFDDGSVRNWNVARRTTFSIEKGKLLMTIEGFGTSGSYTNLVMWGTNRESKEFYTSIVTPVVHRQTCDWDPCSGVKVHKVPSEDAIITMTFGYDDSHQQVTGDACPTSYRIDWAKHENSGVIYKPLP